MLSYTVDFEYAVNGQTFELSLPGGSFARLGDLVTALGILSEDGEAAMPEDIQKFLADIRTIEFSAPELLWVGRVEADATIAELKALHGLECAYSDDLTPAQIDEINASTVLAGEWIVISLKPFDSEETLTVTMNDGERFVIRVTDGQIRRTVISDSGETWEITVTYDESAMIPDGAELVVREILPSL